MRVAFAADDENETTRAVVTYLSQAHTVLPVTEATDWPSIGAAVGRAVSTGDADLGVVMCWTGTGTAIAANKVAGVRAALAWEPLFTTDAELSLSGATTMPETPCAANDWTTSWIAPTSGQ